MSDTAEFTIGSDVSRSDGACGELKRVVVDPDLGLARVVTTATIFSDWSLISRLRRLRGALVLLLC